MVLRSLDIKQQNMRQRKEAPGHLHLPAQREFSGRRQEGGAGRSPELSQSGGNEVRSLGGPRGPPSIRQYTEEGGICKGGSRVSSGSACEARGAVLGTHARPGVGPVPGRWHVRRHESQSTERHTQSLSPTERKTSSALPCSHPERLPEKTNGSPDLTVS